MSEDAKWYVIHTYSGYENKVKANIEKTIENRGLHKLFVDIRVPMEDIVETKEGEQKITQKKIYPSYVFIKMLMTDESWYVVRNTRGVTGFVGPGSKPVPLTEDETVNMGVEKASILIAFEPGESVKIIDGPFESFIAVVDEIFPEKQMLRLSVSLFGRETAIELAFSQVEALV